MSCCAFLADALLRRSGGYHKDDIFESTLSSVVSSNDDEKVNDDVGVTTTNDVVNYSIHNNLRSTKMDHIDRNEDLDESPHYDADGGSKGGISSGADHDEGANGEQRKHQNNEGAFMPFTSSIGEHFSDQQSNYKQLPEEGFEQPDESNDNDENENECYELNEDKETHKSLESYETLENDTSIEEKRTMDIQIRTAMEISPRTILPLCESLIQSDEPQKEPKLTTTVDNNDTNNVQSTTTTERSKSPTNKSKKQSKLHLLNQDILSKLAIDVPTATDAERKRFLIARKGDYKGASKQLKEYIEWRKEHGIDEIKNVEADEQESMSFGSCETSVGAQDKRDWQIAAEAATAFYNNNGTVGVEQQGGSNIDDDHHLVKLPQLAHMVTDSETYLKDKNDNRILLLLPAQLNLDEVNAKTYALAIGLYLDAKLDRNAMEKIVVAIDLRAGQGWTNPSAAKVVPFMKCVVSLLERNFPERLALSVLFPFPSTATILWRVVRVFLDPSTASKIIIIAGKAGIHDTVSLSKFEKICDANVKNRMEEIRQDCFVLLKFVCN